MTIYTQDPGQGINQPIGNVQSGLGESLASTFEQGLDEGPLMSSLRLNRVQGLINDDSPMVPKSEADAALKQYGVKSIIIPDEGVTKSYLDNVVSSRKDTLAKQQIAAAAPSGFIATPLNLLSGLAGAMSDPGNLAIGLVPFAGEARAATLLGRAGERFLQGSVIGGAQTAATLPFTAQAEAALGDDYTLGNAMETLFYGTVGGGLLYAGGGAISDLFRGRRTAGDGATQADSAPIVNETAPISESPPRSALRESDSETPFLNETITREADSYAYSQAYDDIVPDYVSELDVLQTGFRNDVGDIHAQIADNNYQASLLDRTLSERASQYQQQRVKSRDARQRAQRDIDNEKQAFQEKNEQLNSMLDRNATAERARGEQAAISRGEIPEGLRSLVESRASEIRAGLQRTPLAQGVRTASQRISQADWTVQHNAFRAGLSHMLQGKSPDVEPFFNLTAPELRSQSMDRIRSGPRSDAEPNSEIVSRQADADYQRATRDDGDLQNAIEDFDAEMNLAQNRINDIDSPELREALNNIRNEANDESIIKGLQAYASCMLRRL